MSEQNASNNFIEIGRETPEQLEREKWNNQYYNGELDLPEYIYSAEAMLKDKFDIKNLTTIEKWWLKKIAEEIMPNYKKQRQMRKDREIESPNTPKSPAWEITGVWLNRLYGIDDFDAIHTFGSRIITDYSNQQNLVKYEYPYIPRLEEKMWEGEGPLEDVMKGILKVGKNDKGESAYDKEVQLKAEGKRWGYERDEKIEVSSALKEHIRRLREESHS